MYQLPEYKLGKEYYYVEFSIEKLSFVVRSCHGKVAYLAGCSENNIFATHELAQIEANRRNAENKLRNLAREREKEFPIDKDAPVFVFRFADSFINKFTVELMFIDDIYPLELGFNGFKSKKEAYEWFLSVMSESDIQALCQPRWYV